LLIREKAKIFRLSNLHEDLKRLYSLLTTANIRSGPGGANEEYENKYFENLLVNTIRIAGMIANTWLKKGRGNLVDGRSEIAKRCPLFSSQQGIIFEVALLVWENSCSIIIPL